MKFFILLSILFGILQTVIYAGKIGQVKRYYEESKKASLDKSKKQSSISSSSENNSSCWSGASEIASEAVKTANSNKKKGLTTSSDDECTTCLDDYPSPSYLNYPYYQGQKGFLFFSDNDENAQSFFGKLDFMSGLDTGSSTKILQLNFSQNFYRFFIGLGGSFLFENGDTLTLPYVRLGFDMINDERLFFGLIVQASTISELNESQVGGGFRLMVFPIKPLTLSLSYIYSSGDFTYLNHFDAAIGIQTNRITIWGGIYLLGFSFANIEDTVDFAFPYLKLSIWF